MKLRKKTSALAVATLCALLITDTSQGIVLFTFAAGPGDTVIATVTGSFTAPTTGVMINRNGLTGLAGTSTSLYSLNAVYNLWRNGSSIDSGLKVAPSSSTLANFGFGPANLRLPGTVNDGGTWVVPPGSSFTWTNVPQGLEGVGLGSLSKTDPLTVYTSDGASDTMRFIAVPEPSTALFGCLSLMPMVLRRRRTPGS